MAIGTRILSDNLSGKTADVTFLPLSGGTINVGMETIPFNYYDTYPYGTYQLYFAEYDYTYELIIPDPTPLQLNLQVQYTPGSLVAKYTLDSNIWLNENITVSFVNTLGVFDGSDLEITTGITISKGSKTAQTIVTLNEDFNNYNGNSSFSPFSGVPSGGTITTEDLTPNKQSITFWSILTGGTNFGATTFAFGPLTAQTIDFGIDSVDYNRWSLYPLTNRGYGYYFMKKDYSELITIFADAYGTELDRITLSNNNINWDVLDGGYVYVSDSNNGVYYYSDGFSSYTFTWDYANYPYTDIEWDYYAVTSNNSFIIKIWNDSGEYKHYLINKGSSTLLDTFDNNLVYKWYLIYPFANYIIRFTQNIDGDTNLLSFEILELDGITVRRTIDLSGGHYNSWSYAYWSNNKFCLIFWDGDNTSEPYRIISYDGLTDTLNNLTFGNRDNYPQVVFSYNDKFGVNNNGSDSFFLLLYQSSGNEWYGFGMNRLKIFYMLSGQTTFSQYTFNDSGTPNKYLYPYGESGNNLFRYCSTGGTDFSVLSITQSGAQITQIALIGPSTAVGQDTSMFGDKYIQHVWKNDTYQELQLNLFNKFGQITDVLELTLGGAFDRDQAYRTGVYYITDFTYGWWVNESTDTFQLTTSYNISYPDSYFSPDGYRPGILGLWKETGGNTYFRILKNDGLTSEWSLPSNNGSRNFRVGRTYFIYAYNDNVVNLFNWIFYDFEGNAVTSLTTDLTNPSFSVWSVKDRYAIRVTDGDNYRYYGVWDGGYVTSTTKNSEWSLINDYIWWD